MIRIGTVALMGALTSGLCQSAMGIMNNGFDTDSIYTIKGAPSGSVGQLTRRPESNPGGSLGDLLPVGSPYVSLTFSGFTNNDAHLYVLGPNGTSDLKIAELSPTGAIVQQKNLSQILGFAPGSGQGFTGGVDSGIGNIRYNRYHNSLIVSGNPNVNPADPPHAGMAWEISLDLGTLLHTYVGPNGTDRPFNTAFNERTGALYMIGRSNQDVVAFDTVGRALGGTTSTFATLIDHNTIGPSLTGNGWITPKAPIYRDARLLHDGLQPDEDTLVTLVNNGNNTTQYEFFLNESTHPRDANGNLIRRTNPVQGWNAWNGQQDEVTGDIWFGNIASGGTNGGIGLIRSDDTTGRFFTGTGFYDIDSPVPEPASLGLFIISLLGLMQRPKAKVG